MSVSDPAAKSSTKTLAIFTVIIFLGSVVTGWHYLIDSLAGLALAAACFFGVRAGFSGSEATG